jgi:hypothetical protein
MSWPAGGANHSTTHCKHRHSSVKRARPLAVADDPFDSVQNDKSRRYVAQENIVYVLRKDHDHDDSDADGPNASSRLGQGVVELMGPETFPAEIGRWFLRWDPLERVFVSNIRDEYPDD